MGNWYEKSKHNNMPIIEFTGRCPICGGQKSSFMKGSIIECCLYERIVCDYARDINENKEDCQFTNKSLLNDGLVAKLINEGMPENEALDEYRRRYFPIPKLNDLLPFGKYKDKPVGEIIQSDIDYMEWVLKNIEGFKHSSVIVDEIRTFKKKTH